MTIRDVPEDVRDTLAARAAGAGQSLQEHVRALLVDVARRPSPAEWVEQVRRRKAAMQSGVTSRQILEHLDEGRR
jgi:antitoxin FitA